MTISTQTITLTDLSEATIQSAVAAANGFGGTTTISFGAGLAGGTVLLTAALELRADIIIDGDTNGDGKADITISGQDQVRVFWLNLAGADVTLRSLNIVDGKGVGTFGSGGAIATNDGTTLKVVNSTISGSHSDSAGGAIAANGEAVIVNSTIHGNDADVRGGAIYMFGGKDLTLVNTTITGNSADHLGGGISVGDHGTIFATNSTIAGNSAGDEGGGIELGQFRAVNLTNTIVAGNTAPNNANVVRFGPSFADINANHSIVGSDVTITNDGGGNIVADTGIVAALSDNGGLVKTMAPTLIAIDKGTALSPIDYRDADSDGLTDDPLSVDARGSARLLGSAVDIGAHERIGGPSFASSITEDGAATVDNLALHTSLGTAIISTGNLDSSSPLSISPDGTVLLGTYGSLKLFQDGYYIYTLDNADPDTDALEDGDMVSETFTAKALLVTGAHVNVDFATITITIEGADDVNFVTGGKKSDLIDLTHSVNGRHSTNGMDFIRSQGGDDTVKALGGDDTVQGGTGDDQLDGGGGDDTVDYSDHELDLTIALRDGKKATQVLVDGVSGDTIKAFENVIGGKGDDVVTGNKAANMLIGGLGDDELDGGGRDDILDGGKGRNTLTGGDGDDQFWFLSAPSKKTSNIITDFKHGDDLLVFDATIYAVLGDTVDEEEFVVTSGAKAPKAKEADDHLLYNQKTAKLYWDADGNGHKAAILLATFDKPKPHLDVTDFDIV